MIAIAIPTFIIVVASATCHLDPSLLRLPLPLPTIVFIMVVSIATCHFDCFLQRVRWTTILIIIVVAIVDYVSSLSYLLLFRCVLLLVLCCLFCCSLCVCVCFFSCVLFLCACVCAFFATAALAEHHVSHRRCCHLDPFLLRLHFAIATNHVDHRCCQCHLSP
jgi:hypothetical protein